jgi:hypothetical protein
MFVNAMAKQWTVLCIRSTEKRKHERERPVRQSTKIICYLFGGSEAKGTGDSEAQRNDWS